MGYDELEGDDDDIILAGEEALEGDEELGLSPNPFRRGGRGKARRRGGGGMAIARRMNTAQITAQRRASALRQYQPDARGDALDQIVPFTALTLTAAAPTGTMTAQPQRAFMLRRLVIELGRTGATAVASLVTVTALTVGADPQFVATGGIPASAFAFNAVGVRLKPNAARPGITIFLGMAAAGLVAPDTVAVSAMGIGPAIG
jgi:hypothetical protein